MLSRLKTKIIISIFTSLCLSCFSLAKPIHLSRGTCSVWYETVLRLFHELSRRCGLRSYISQPRQGQPMLTP
ncbi:hypothetical protein F5B21DRAFT_454252 [Xylaria acuta]|nr:hypothetical protein F5B21DRAFT_454252 [Xylaria acuta]